MRKRKDSLMTYLEDGRCSLSNNLSENTIRPITIE
ncbi:transposase [Anaerostipes hadrus]|nr:transposase [Anaerostipes hadrus]